MTWEHILDKREEAPTDISPVYWQNGGIIEGGTIEQNGKKIPWAEEWVRLTDDSVKPETKIYDKYVWIAVGDYAIRVKDERPTGKFTATRFHRVDGQWTEIGSVKA